MNSLAPFLLTIVAAILAITLNVIPFPRKLGPLQYCVLGGELIVLVIACLMDTGKSHLYLTVPTILVVGSLIRVFRPRTEGQKSALQ